MQLPLKLPFSHFSIACSGGADSIFAAYFIASWKKCSPTLLFFHHRTPEDDEALEVVRAHADRLSSELIVGRYSGDKVSEGLWRDERYRFLSQYATATSPVITAHNLDDVVETYIMSALHGTAKLIPFVRDPFILRPFLCVRHSEMVSFLHERNIAFYEDATNADISLCSRNLIRHQIVPAALGVNAGLYSMIRRKLLSGIGSLGKNLPV